MSDDLDFYIPMGIILLMCVLSVSSSIYSKYKFHQQSQGLRDGYVVIYEGHEASDAEIDMIQRNENNFVYGYDDELEQVVVAPRR